MIMIELVLQYSLRISRAYFVAIVCLFSINLPIMADEDLPTEAVQEFVTVLEQVKRNYIVEQSDPALIESAIRGMVESLDNYSRYLNAQELKQFEASGSGTSSKGQTIWQIKQLKSGTVYLDINFFQLTLEKYIQDALNKLPPAEGIIIDLRDNGGGFVDSALAVADLFLADQLVVRSRGRSAAATRNLKTNAETPFRDIPVVVLINQDTASAAEIFSAAIQDHQRGLILGSKSYGKGSVQSLIYTSVGAIQITTSLNLRPSGAAIEQIGVNPDISVTTGTQTSLPDKEANNLLIIEAINLFNDDGGETD